MARKKKKIIRRKPKTRNIAKEINLTELEDLIKLALETKDPQQMRQAENGLAALYRGGMRTHKVLHYLGVFHSIRGEHEKGIRLIQESLELNSQLPVFFLNLGIAHAAADQWREATDAYSKALDLDPDFMPALLRLGSFCMQRHMYPGALKYFQRVLKVDPGFTGAYHDIALIHLNQNQKDKAKEYLSKYLELKPSDESANHLMASLKGEGVTTTSEEYVAQVFDGYADKFETHLTEGLSYDAPALLRQAVERVVSDEKPHSWKIIDLGCGTGLCGPLFSDMADRMIGVDLSEKMLEKAVEKDVYDQLHHTDLTEALKSHQGDLDLAISADVLIYVGELDGVFQECARALRDGGILAFTTEAFSGEGFFLRQTGRFAHSSGYIHALADKHGFSIRLEDDIVPRFDRGKPISGKMYVLSKGERAGTVADAEVSVQPEQIEETMDKALAHHEAGHLAEAEKLYRGILGFDPEHANALHFLGVIEFQRGKLDEASGLIFRAIEQLPQVPQFHNNLALVRQAQGRLEGAVDSLRKAVELDPTYVDALNNLGIVLKELNRLDEAANCFEQLLQATPNSPEVHNNLGNVYVAQGRLKEAIERYNTAFTQNTEFSDAARNLAKALMHNGDAEKAADFWQRLLKLVPGDSEATAGLDACLVAASNG